MWLRESLTNVRSSLTSSTFDWFLRWSFSLKECFRRSRRGRNCCFEAHQHRTRRKRIPITALREVKILESFESRQGVPTSRRLSLQRVRDYFFDHFLSLRLHFPLLWDCERRFSFALVLLPMGCCRFDPPREIACVFHGAVGLST